MKRVGKKTKGFKLDQTFGLWRSESKVQKDRAVAKIHKLYKMK